MIEIVNGYVCRNCAEAADAKRGKNPHAKPGELPSELPSELSGDKDKDKGSKISAFADQPATIVDGALKGLVSANPVTAATVSDTSSQVSARSPQSGIDRIA